MIRTVGLLVLLVFSGLAQSSELWDSIKKETSAVAEKSSKVLSKTKDKVSQSIDRKEDKQHRTDANFSLNVNLAPVNIPFPMAWGVSGYYFANENWMLGLDYLNGSKAIKVFSFELGEVKERSYTLQAKRFFGNSFNIKMGVGRRSTEVLFARNLFDLATKNYTETAAEFDANYFRLGMGNQWSIKSKYTLAVDWISIDVPFSSHVRTSASQYANSEESAKDIEDAEHILKYYPGGAIFKFDIGVTF
jgi:hypothetical protein